jgi:DNA primase
LNQSDFLFGLYQNRKYIEESGSVIVFESAKSVMKMETNGINNVVSIETSHFSDQQINLLLSLKCDIIIALDNDVALDVIKQGVRKLTKMTNVYVIKDTLSILDEKDAPCDKGFDIWEKLYEYKVRL